MIENWLWVTVRWFPVVAVAVLGIIFARRRLWHRLPFFFLYVACALLFVAVQLVSFRVGRKAYFYGYWITDLASSVVVLLPMYEVFLRRLFPGFQRNRFYRSAFPVFAGLIFVLAVLTALQSPDKGSAFQMASRAFDFMRTAILVFFIGLMALMGRQWTRYDLGVTLGFGIQAAVALANSAVKARMHYRPTVLDFVELFAYNLSCLIWLVTFWKPERPSQIVPAEQLDPAMLHQARGWEQQLKTWLTPRKDKG
jgi:hypothetical protein